MKGVRSRGPPILKVYSIEGVVHDPQSTARRLKPLAPSVTSLTMFHIATTSFEMMPQASPHPPWRRRDALLVYHSRGALSMNALRVLARIMRETHNTGHSEHYSRFS